MRRSIAGTFIMCLLVGSCTKRVDTSSDGAACALSGGKINAQIASYDVAVGPPSRFITGLLVEDNRLVSFGQVKLRFAYCGTKDAPKRGAFGSVVQADFLALPPALGETAPPVRDGPVAGPASQGRGVYAAPVSFDQAGFWRMEVTADLVGEGTQTGVADFEVLAKHQVPAPGDTAIATENLTMTSVDAPKEAIDSRASTDEGIPDAELHQTSIAKALSEHRPVLVVFSTPVYCQSRFCGPITDMVAGLARDYSNRAAFIHIEIWRDFNGRMVNKAAADWIFRNDNLNEPWVFLIGADGKIVARWDNVATRGEIEPLLSGLPAS
jgi:hypothetical protein